MKILREQGIDEETAERLISDTYKKCKNIGVTLSKIATYIEDLIKFSDQVPLPEIELILHYKTDLAYLDLHYHSATALVFNW